MEMSSYCKAYPVSQLRTFSGWTENIANRCRDREVEGEDSGNPPEDYYFLHDNLFVTDGIFRDENVIFAEVSQEWSRFCTEVLQFQASEAGAAAAPPQE